jgi:medium-chain acyl-[acyl-carrier-protein] hydrolase
MKKNKNPWIKQPKPNPQARLRLFCFPYAGGGASVFRLWPDDLLPDIEVCSILLPGREHRLREPLFTRISPLVKRLAQEIEPYLDKPIAFFGHSLGSLVSFELARELRRLQAPMPKYLFVSGRRAPQIPQPLPHLHSLPDAAFWQRLRRYDGTPEVVLQHAELMELFLPILRADFGLNETYAYYAEEPFDFPIYAFGGFQDKTLNREEILPWREHTRASFSLRMFRGGHFFINDMRKPMSQLILQALKPQI